mmetsp:Transcript_26618/g.56042  ORF Transcript_26618/g.56042 Transcript_26618/m.56042 type:complete len:197 (+) Transcript_26618:74-664(+)
MKLISSQYGTESSGNVETVCLPPHFSKFGIYLDWSFSEGHIVTWSNRSRTKINPLILWEYWSCDEEWPEGSSPGDIVLFSLFKRFWQHQFLDLKIQACGADICDKCFELIDAIRASARKKYEILRDDNEVDDKVSGGEILQQLISATEKTEAGSRRHIKHYQSHRNLVNRMVSIAKQVELLSFVASSSSSFSLPSS